MRVNCAAQYNVPIFRIFQPIAIFSISKITVKIVEIFCMRQENRAYVRIGIYSSKGSI